MHVHLKRAGAVAFLTAAAGVLSSSCAPDESSLFIRGCMQIPRESCIVAPSVSGTFLSGGFIDAFYRAEYECQALMENQLVARADTNKLRTETDGVTFYEAEVQVLTVDQPPKVITRSDGSAAQFTVPITGFADPGNGGTPGLGLTGITMLDFATLKDLKNAAHKSGTVQQVVSSVQVRGRTLGGLEVQSNVFKFPINVGAGDTCVNPPGASCAGGTTVPPTDCILGQDEATGVDCRNLACSQLECEVITKTGMAPALSLSTAHCPADPFNVNPAKNCCIAGP